VPVLPDHPEVSAQVQRFERATTWLAGTPLQALAPTLDKWFTDNL